MLWDHAQSMKEKVCAFSTLATDQLHGLASLLPQVYCLRDILNVMRNETLPSSSQLSSVDIPNKNRSAFFYWLQN
jgi:hypothetical protein